MKINVTMLALLGLALVPTLGFGFSSKTARAKCEQNLTQAQNISCGNISAPLAINVSGGGTVNFGPTACFISADQSATQQAKCVAKA